MRSLKRSLKRSMNDIDNVTGSNLVVVSADDTTPTI
jgi:hypothetical protein